MEINLSFTTVCGLRDCVVVSIEVAKKGRKVLGLPTEDQKQEIEILKEYLSMLEELLDVMNT